VSVVYHIVHQTTVYGPTLFTVNHIIHKTTVPKAIVSYCTPTDRASYCRILLC